MNIAVVGGGNRCKVLIDMLDKFTLKDINPIIVGVADINQKAPGLIKAKQNDIDHIISQSILLTRKQAAFNDIAIEKKIPGTLPWIHIDKDQIQQALINLIMNAAEATVPGDTIHVTANFVPEDEFIEIAVKDTGEGMTQDQIDKVFEPFFTTKDTGTGLGMAITHGIVERHGGTMDIKSKPERGTTITMRLPINSGVEDGN